MKRQEATAAPVNASHCVKLKGIDARRRAGRSGTRE